MRLRKLLAATLLLSSVAFGQGWKGKGRVEGLVTDEAGRPIAGAKLALRLNGAGPDLVTDTKGRWAVLGIAGGSWDLDIDADGYAARRISGIKVSEINRLPPVEVKLEAVQPAAPATVVTGGGVPKEAALAVKRGDDLLAQKKFAEAAAEYESALGALPDHPALLMQLARAYHGAGQDEKSTKMLERVLDKDPGNVGALLLLGNTALEKGDLEKGKMYLDRVPAAAITDPTTYVNTGILYLNKQKSDSAEDYFGRAITLDPKSPDAYYYRGLARMAGKKNAEARADFQKYIELAPNGPEAADVRQYLAILK